MNPHVLLFCAYVAVADENIYDAEWLLLDSIMHSEGASQDTIEKVLQVFGNADDKVPLDDVIVALRDLPADEKSEALALALRIAYADGTIGRAEESLLERFRLATKIEKREYAKLVEEIKKQPPLEVSGKIDKTPRKRGATLFKLLAKITPPEFSERMKQRYRDCLLSGPNYAEKIEEMRKIALEDLESAESALGATIEAMDKSVKELQPSVSKVKQSAKQLVSSSSKKEGDERDNLDEAVNIIQGINAEIAKEITDAKEALDTSLAKKRESVSHYTISFMGRTKAGKSTLHSVILGGHNQEFIGKGQERTTRYNRVYGWNGIRIIDTPGIGAPGGKSDTEIARGIVDESDLICYVVTSDSIQETEFSFLKGLKKQNKPIIVLLNKKDNFKRSSKKLAAFLADPLDWYHTSGKDSLEGHKTRIREYVKTHFPNVYLEIIPVHLLAAQESLANTDNKIARNLREGSRIDCFLDELRIQILQCGVLRRSQSILNDSIYHINEYEKSSSAKLKDLAEVAERISNQSGQAIAQAASAAQETRKRLENGVRTIFDSFIANDLQEYCELHYDDKKNDESFKTFFADSGFEGKLSARIDMEIESYRRQIASILQELSEKLTFSFDFKFKPSSFSIRVLNTKGIVKSICAVVAAIGVFAGPIGLAVSIVATGIGWLANTFLKSKTEKVRSAKAKFYDSFKEDFGKERDLQVEKVLSKFDANSNETEARIRQLFSDIHAGLLNSIQILSPLNASERDSLERLNRCYALRVLDSAIHNFRTKTNVNTVSVSRDLGKTMRIVAPSLRVKPKDVKRISEIIQEELTMEDANEQH